MEDHTFNFSSKVGHAPVSVSPISMFDHYLILTCVYFEEGDSSSSRGKKDNPFKLDVPLLKDDDSNEAIRMVSTLRKFYNQDRKPRERLSFLVSA